MVASALGCLSPWTNCLGALDCALYTFRIFYVCPQMVKVGEDSFRLMCSAEMSRITEQVFQYLPFKMKHIHLLLLVL